MEKGEDALCSKDKGLCEFRVPLLEKKENVVTDSKDNRSKQMYCKWVYTLSVWV